MSSLGFFCVRFRVTHFNTQWLLRVARVDFLADGRLRPGSGEANEINLDRINLVSETVLLRVFVPPASFFFLLLYLFFYCHRRHSIFPCSEVVVFVAADFSLRQRYG